MVRSRQLLSCPTECPSRVYSLMVECWSEVPLRRPTFTEIHNRLRSWEGLASVGAPGSTIGGPPPIPATLPPASGAMLTNRSHSGIFRHKRIKTYDICFCMIPRNLTNVLTIQVATVDRNIRARDRAITQAQPI